MLFVSNANDHHIVEGEGAFHLMIKYSRGFITGQHVLRVSINLECGKKGKLLWIEIWKGGRGD